MSYTHPFVTVALLQKILSELPITDVIGTRTKANTGNLPILRGGHQVGYIEVYDDQTHVKWDEGYGPEEKKGNSRDDRE